MVIKRIWHTCHASQICTQEKTSSAVSAVSRTGSSCVGSSGCGHFTEDCFPAWAGGKWTATNWRSLLVYHKLVIIKTQVDVRLMESERVKAVDGLVTERSHPALCSTFETEGSGERLMWRVSFVVATTKQLHPPLLQPDSLTVLDYCCHTCLRYFAANYLALLQIECGNLKSKYWD